MSQENVEVVRAVLNALNRRDIEAVLSFADSQIQRRPITSALSGEIYHGHAGLQRWIEEIYRDWEVFENAPEQFHDLGDRVLAVGTWHVRGPKERASTRRTTGRVARKVALRKDHPVGHCHKPR